MKFLPLLACLLCAYTIAIAQDALPKMYFIHGGDTLRYRLQYPVEFDSSRTYPLVIFLHGSGARGSDNERQLSNLPAVFTDFNTRRQYPAFLLVPQCPANDVWANFPDFPKSLTTIPTPAGSLVLALVRDWSARPYIDKGRLYITGYSMGGEGTLDLVARAPNLFAAAAAICPVADTATAPSISHVPIWIFHGNADKVNDVSYSRMMVAALRRFDNKVRYTEYPGVGHACWHQAYAEKDFFSWMFGQHK